MTIPNSVTSIGYAAFANCSSLKSVTIPDSVTSIGSDAFYNCSSLTSVTIGNSVTSIGSSAFSGCSKLTNISVSRYNNNFSSSDGVLFSKDKKTLIICPPGRSGDYSIPDSVTSIGDNAFVGCSKLTSVTIPDSVTSIGDDAFDGCSKLTSVTIPDSVTSIGDDAFYACNSLTSVTIGDSVTSIGSDAFYGCNRLKDIYISDLGAWCELSGIYELVVRNSSAKNIYLNGVLLKDNIIVPDGTEKIAPYAFYNFSQLTNISIPDSVLSIGDSAFSGCGKLQDIYISDLGAWCELSGIYELVVRNSSAKNIYSDGVLLKDNIIVPDGTEKIAPYAFYNFSQLSNISIPISVNEIGDHAFKGCSTLQNVYYTGTKDDFIEVFIGSDNSYFTNAHKKYEHTHSFINYVSNNDATCTADGTKTAKCELCDVTSTVPDEGSKTDHSFINYISNNNATCTSDGTKTAKCEFCEATSTVLDVGTKLPHTFTNYVSDENATCTEDGTKTARCDYCEATDTIEELGTKLNHDLIHHDAQPATTTQPGWEEYDTCSRCDYSTFVELPVLHTHSYSPVTTPATCTSGGYTTYTCSGCGHSYLSDYTDMLSHDYNSVTTPASCKAGGYTTHTCSVCEHSYTDAQTPAAAHTPANAVTENESAATCKSCGGYDEVIYCSVCNQELSRVHEKTDRLEHDYNSVTTPASCKAGGYTTRTCSVCGHSYIYAQTPAAAHTPASAVTENESAATCKSCGGYDEVVYCSVCNQELSRIHKSTPKAQHNYGTSVTAPTCTTTGYTTHTCSVCGSAYIDAITPCTAHNFSDWQLALPSTCVQQKVMARVCSDCGAIDALEGDYGEHDTVTINAHAASCTQKGYTGDQYCTVCQQTVSQGKDTEKTSHNYKDGKCTACGADDPNYNPGGNDDGGNFFSKLIEAIMNILRSIFPFC